MIASDQHYRPQYHFSPPANWLNDPNGLVYYQGEYHLFYQYHPNSTVWGPMHWGHAISADLIHWQHLPIALYPDENGVIYSGCALIDWDNTAGFGKEAMIAIFTHDQNEQQRQYQSLAFSTDRGRSWTKYAGNPVLLPPEHLRDFRDPKVFWYNENQAGHWVMVLAASDRIRFYSSPDLRHWEPCGSFQFENSPQFGPLETPDLFQLAVQGSSESRWVLTLGTGVGGPGAKSGMRYFIGQFNGKTFTADNPNRISWLDFGADFYAAQTWSDEPNARRLMIGWMNNWEYATVIPTTTWRGVFSMPRELSLQPTGQGIRLFQQPIPELSTLRAAHARWQNIELAPGSNLLADLRGDSYEIQAEFQLNPASGSFGFRIRVGDHEQTTIGYNGPAQKIWIDRSNSGQTGFDTVFPRIHAADMAPVNGTIRLGIWVDRSTVEIFGNAGQVVFSDNIYPDEKSQGLVLFVEGGKILLNSLDIFQLTLAAID